MGMILRISTHHHAHIPHAPDHTGRCSAPLPLPPWRLPTLQKYQVVDAMVGTVQLGKGMTGGGSIPRFLATTTCLSRLSAP